jgi:hypothetical protein
VVCALVAGFVLNNLPGLTGDTIALVHGAHTINYCLSHGITSNCDRLPQFVPGSAAILKAHGVVQGAVAQFPLPQYVPAVLLTRLGMSDLNIYKALSIISLLSFVGVVALCAWTASRTGRRWAPALTVVILTTSPLMYYSWSTFGESLAAFLIVLLAVAALRRWPPWVLAFCALWATLTKETVFPIVVLIGAAALWATPIAARPLRRAHWAGFAIGVLGGIAVAAAFNWFRYHQLTNWLYGQSFLQVPGMGRRLGLSVALWLAPNGGLALFWTLFAVVTLGVVAIFVMSLRRRPVSVKRILPAGALVVALLLITGMLASWFTPFGWYAWGPRLMLPPLPAILLVALVVYAEEVETVARSLLATPVRGGLVAAVVVAFGLPQVNVLHASAVVGEMFTPDKICPVAASVQVDPGHYYHCLNHLAWGRHWLLPSTFKALDHVGGVVFAIVFAAAWIWLLWSTAASLRSRREYRQAEPVVVGAAS